MIMDNDLKRNFDVRNSVQVQMSDVLSRVRQNFAAVGTTIAMIGLSFAEPVHAQCAPEREAYVAIDAQSGDVLLDHDSQERIQPASMTKLMTLLLAYEALQEGDISEDSLIYINKNRQVQRSSGWSGAIKFGDALKGAALRSYNDLSITIGENVAKARGLGNTEFEFVSMMNEKAREIGMDSTRFYNASGLPRAVVRSRQNGSTASDMAILLKYIADTQPDLIRLLGTDEVQVRRGTLRNTNTLLHRDDVPYEAVSGKTGFTCDAGFALTAMVEKDGERVIFSYVGGASPQDRESRVLEISGQAFDTLIARRAAQDDIRMWLERDWNYHFPLLILEPDQMRAPLGEHDQRADPYHHE